MTNRFNEEEDFIGELNDLLELETTPEVKAEIKALEVEDEPYVLIPLDYSIFSTSDNTPNGKRDIVDTYKCDRVKGIVPSGKAKIKADLMKKAFSNKKFFVEETSSKIYDNGRVKTVSKIYYQTK